ncbi:ribonuclease R [bacterium D16-54]|nr:ribonuclease R [bacterium D16-54]RKJ14984.1 ribonuclease R [bacterium D16-56]
MEDLMRERKEHLLAAMKDPMYVPMKLKELAMLFDVPKEQREELKEVLDVLVAEGRLTLSKRGKYSIPEASVLAGIFSGNVKGFGFVSVEGRDQDLFIPADKTMGAMHGDRVQITAMPGQQGRRAEGAVTRVLERANRTVVGYYQKSRNYGFVMPDNRKLGQDIFIPQGQDMGAVTGHKVVVEITDYGSPAKGSDQGRGKSPEGVVTEILGHANDPGVDILSLVRAYDLPEAFPDDVMEEAGRTRDEVTAEELAGRKDLRSLLTVTIDGEDAKDLDDAITISREDFGYRLGVHIADVTHYVKEGSPMDEEALKRGTSVYLVDRVIPMLPHKLSNGICSLNAGTDRLALSCIMDIDLQGKVLGHEIAETVIHVDRRMTYTAVNAIVTDRNREVMEEYADFVEMFDQMKALADILRKKRKARGSIDFDLPETKVLLDRNGTVLEVKPYDRNDATKIIEDFMLMANETVAEDYFWQDLPFLYRTHDNPDPEKMKRLGMFINNFGYAIHFQNGEIHPGELQKLLTRIEGSEEETLISRLTLRSMKQAKYMPVCTGHFGLAARYYTHFTSPIRRYPDLQIHRIIKENLRGSLTEERISHYHKIMMGVAVQSSAMERRADEAERETVKLKKCEYMERQIGQVFEGVISGVTNHGFYVELPSTVEGMVSVNDLQGEYYVFDEEQMELRGEITGRAYRLGQKVRVAVAGTDRMNRTIDFAVAKEPEVQA